MNDFRARLFQEHSELTKRVEKLEQFILQPAFDALPDIDRADLRDQLTHMKAYSAVLMRRVSRLCNNA